MVVFEVCRGEAKPPHLSIKEAKWKLKNPFTQTGFCILSQAATPCCVQDLALLPVGTLKSLFSVFALKELEPGVPACPGKLHAKASAGAERQPSPGHGHGPAAFKVRRSSAPFPISHTLHSQIPLSSRLTNPWCNHPELFPWELSLAACCRHFLF